MTQEPDCADHAVTPIAQPQLADVLGSHRRDITLSLVIRRRSGGCYSHNALVAAPGHTLEATFGGVGWVDLARRIGKSKYCDTFRFRAADGAVWNPDDVVDEAKRIAGTTDPKVDGGVRYLQFDVATAALVLSTQRKVTIPTLIAVRLYSPRLIRALQTKLDRHGFFCGEFIAESFYWAARDDPRLGIKISPDAKRLVPLKSEHELNREVVAPDQQFVEPPLVTWLRGGAGRWRWEKPLPSWLLRFPWARKLQKGLASPPSHEDRVLDHRAGAALTENAINWLVEPFNEFVRKAWHLLLLNVTEEEHDRLVNVAKACRDARNNGSVPHLTAGFDYPSWLVTPFDLENSPSLTRIGRLQRTSRSTGRVSPHD